jgi:hypothetical protein
MLRNWLLSLLPPWNLARLFSAYRIVEAAAANPCQVCAVKDEMIGELREQAKVRENYILSLLGQRPINTQSQPQKPSMTATAGSQSLRGLRRSHVVAAVAKAQSDIDTNGMASRAAEYAEKVKAG